MSLTLFSFDVLFLIPIQADYLIIIGLDISKGPKVQKDPIDYSVSNTYTGRVFVHSGKG